MSAASARGAGVRLAAHGIALTLPPGWNGRVFSRGGAVATLHAGDFALALHDGEFGDQSTAQMPGSAVFLALTEYRPGEGLEPGRGLFAPRGLRLPLDPRAFSPARLAHHRPHQTGAQHFFTAARRPLCLYTVIAGPPRERRDRRLALEHVLTSLTIAARS